MFKKSVGIVLGLGMVLGGALTASAASNITHLTIDGSTNATVQEGDVVSGVLTYDITVSEDVESLSYEIVGSGLPKTCVNIDDHLTDGTFHSSFDIDTNGATEGTWDVKVVLYGTNDEGANQNCEGAGDDTMVFTNRLTIEADETVDNNGNTGAGSSVQSKFDQLMAAFQALMAKLSGTGTSPSPASVACVELAQKSVGTVQGVYNDANIRLQGFLLSEGMQIPALTAGASFGFYGPQTMAAVASFNAIHNCR